MERICEIEYNNAIDLWITPIVLSVNKQFLLVPIFSQLIN